MPVQAQADAEKSREESCDCFASASARRASIAGLLKVTDHAIARCEIKAVDAKMAYVVEKEREQLNHLRRLKSQFQSQVQAYESWGHDAEKGQFDAVQKIKEVGLSYIAGTLTELSSKGVSERIDVMLSKTKGVRDPRRVRIGEVKEWVLSLRQELKGKSRDESKEIIIKSLDETGQFVRDLTVIEKKISGDVARIVVSDDDRDSTQADLRPALDEAYGIIITAIEIAKEHGVKSAVALGKTTTLLGFAPDMIDTAELLYRANVVVLNLDGLDELRAAAESQRRAANRELIAAVQQRHELEKERTHFEGLAAP